MDNRLGVFSTITMSVFMVGAVMIGWNWLFNASFEGVLYTCGKVAFVVGAIGVFSALSLNRIYKW